MEILINAGYENLLPEKYNLDIFSRDLILEIKIIKSVWKRIEADIDKLSKSPEAIDALKIVMFLFYPLNEKTKPNFELKTNALANNYSNNYLSSTFSFKNNSIGYLGFIHVTKP